MGLLLFLSSHYLKPSKLFCDTFYDLFASLLCLPDRSLTGCAISCRFSLSCQAFACLTLSGVLPGYLRHLCPDSNTAKGNRIQDKSHNDCPENIDHGMLLQEDC